MPRTSIRLIVDIYTSATDRCGNRYTVAAFTGVAHGRHSTVWVDCHSESNARRLAFIAAGGDWEAIHYTEQTLPIREWQRLSKVHRERMRREGDPGTDAELARLAGPAAD